MILSSDFDEESMPSGTEESEEDNSVSYSTSKGEKYRNHYKDDYDLDKLFESKEEDISEDTDYIDKLFESGEDLGEMDIQNMFEEEIKKPLEYRGEDVHIEHHSSEYSDHSITDWKIPGKSPFLAAFRGFAPSNQERKRNEKLGRVARKLKKEFPSLNINHADFLKQIEINKQ